MVLVQLFFFCIEEEVSIIEDNDADVDAASVVFDNDVDDPDGTGGAIAADDSDPLEEVVVAATCVFAAGLVLLLVVGAADIDVMCVEWNLVI